MVQEDPMWNDVLKVLEDRLKVQLLKMSNKEGV